MLGLFLETESINLTEGRSTFTYEFTFLFGQVQSSLDSGHCSLGQGIDEQTAVDQLHASKPSTASQGAVMGVFQEARQTVEGAIEEVFTGKKDAKAALDDAAKQITEKIDLYNKTVKK